MYYYPFVRRCPRGTMPYIIKAGDTYYNIALRYNTSVPALIAANPGVDPNFLQIGQTICIPVRPQLPPCPGGNYYTIRPGDTFYSIARRYNISLDALIAANQGVNPDRLLVGQVICIPVTVPPTGCPDGTRPYRIRRGDTFYAIATRFGISLDALIAANPGVDPDRLLVGQVICIPAEMQTQPVECPEGTRPYRIREGDTFEAIAKRFGISTEELAEINPGVDPDALQVGEQIYVPESQK